MNKCRRDDRFVIGLAVEIRTLRALLEFAQLLVVEGSVGPGPVLSDMPGVVGQPAR